MRFFTCTYQLFTPDMGVPVRTTVGAPRFKLKYELTFSLKQAAPTYPMLKMSRPDYLARYLEILDRSGPEEFLRAGQAIAKAAGDDRLVLLCFDDLRKPGAWCHRTMFAEWWLARTGEEVPELQPM